MGLGAAPVRSEQGRNVSALELYGDVRDSLIGLPHYANDDTGTALRDEGYEARYDVVLEELGHDVLRVSSVFEFGCQFGLGLITLLEACKSAIAAGWVDDERAFPGSNEAARRNVLHWAARAHRRLNVACYRHVRKVPPTHFDVVMVDGGHGYHEALCDLAYARAMTPRLLLVDDFPGMPSVREAVAHFAEYYGLSYSSYPRAGAGLAAFRDPC